MQKGVFKSNILILIGMLLLLTNACKPESFGDPPTPSIELGSVIVVEDPQTGLDSIINVAIDYRDGDGDIGLTDADTFSPFRFGDPFFNNLWVELEYMQGGVWVLASDDSLQISQRIVNLTPVGDIKSIRGTLNLNIPVKPTLGFNHKQVKLSFTLVDRSQNTSNKVQSEELILNY